MARGSISGRRCARGELVHFSENDQVFLPGWRVHVEAAFRRVSRSRPASRCSAIRRPTTKPGSRSRRGCAFSRRAGSSTRRRTTSAPRRSCADDPARLRGPESPMYPSTSGSSTPMTASCRATSRHPRIGADFPTGTTCAMSGTSRRNSTATRPMYEENFTNKPLTGVAWLARGSSGRRAGPGRCRQIARRFPSASRCPSGRRKRSTARRRGWWSMYDPHTEEKRGPRSDPGAETRLVKPAHVIETGTWLGLSSCAIARARRQRVRGI